MTLFFFEMYHHPWLRFFHLLTLEGCMMLRTFQDCLEESKEKVYSLDFTMQTQKMVEVLGWDRDAVDEMKDEYLKFLIINSTLKKINDNTTIVPNRIIDEFWHAHIMDTKKYHNDCMIVFGEYFHHFPYFGIQGEQDKKNWESDSSVGASLWYKIFGTNLYGDASGEDAYAIDRKWIAELSRSIIASKFSSSAKCKRTACKPMKCK